MRALKWRWIRIRHRAVAFFRRCADFLPYSRDQPQPIKIPVESSFDVVVRRAGGIPVSDLIPPRPDLEENADYVFLQDKVVLELKTLEKDKFDPTSDTSALIQELVAAGMTGSEIIQWSFGQRALPPDAIRRLISKQRRSLEAAARKARRQIESTIRLLRLEGALGIVLFANDQNHFMSPYDMYDVISDVFAEKMNSPPTDAFIYVSVNVSLVRYKGDLDWYPWIPSYRTGAPDRLVEFVNNLGRAWFKYIRELDPNVRESFETPDPEARDLFSSGRVLRRFRRPSN